MARHIEAVNTAEITSEKLNISISKLADMFAEIPTADVAQVKRGEWTSEIEIEVKQIKGELSVPEKYIHAQCSNCLHCFMMIRKEQYKYCPNCGARMDSELQKEG